MADKAAILLVSGSMKVVSDREIDEPACDRLANLACCAREACGLVAQVADGGAEGEEEGRVISNLAVRPKLFDA
jgi:hypothetical protein